MKLRCSKCQQDKQVKDFYKNKSIARAYTYWCKACLIEARPQKTQTQQQKDAEYQRQYYQEHKVKKQQQRQNYYHMHREDALAKQQIYAAQHKAEKRLYDQQYRRDHPEQAINAVAKRNKILEQFQPITKEQWLIIMQSTAWHCNYCHRVLTTPKGKQYTATDRSIDHVIPLTKGGTHTVDNLVPCCRSCNSKKHNKLQQDTTQQA